jgi:uroporphyrinogen-III decarboxylase
MNGLKQIKKHFDLSEYKREDMKDDTNKKKFGCFTDELNGKVLSEMLGLNPKYYRFKYKYNERIKRVLKDLEDKLTILNTCENTPELNKSSINLQILVLLIYLLSYQTTEKKKNKRSLNSCCS